MSAKSEAQPAGAGTPRTAHPLTHCTRSSLRRSAEQQHEHTAGAIQSLPRSPWAMLGTCWRSCWGQAEHTHPPTANKGEAYGHNHHRPRQRSDDTVLIAGAVLRTRHRRWDHLSGQALQSAAAAGAALLPLWSPKAAGRQQITGRRESSALTPPASIVFPPPDHQQEAQPTPLRVHRRPYGLFSVVG